MAIPTYATDLTTLDDCNTDTGYVEPTATGWAQLNSETFAETDLFIQDANSISASCKTGVGATLFNNTTGVTIPTDGAFLVWAYWSAPNSLDTEANGGIRTIIGAGTANFAAWVHGGKDTYIYGGWINLATNPTVSADYTEGTPGTLQYFGWCYNALAVPSKGNPYVVDCMRYGRCEISAINGDLGSGYATFTGMAAKNDANDVTEGYNRWGLLQAVSASSFLWKGMMALGLTGTAVDFRDSNKSITIDNTKKVTAAFNKVEVRHASSRVDWTSISITSLSSVSPGQFEAIADADINKDGCTFTDMSTFIYQAASTILNTVFRGCGKITQGGATFTDCTIDQSTATIAMNVANAVASVTDTSFTSDGTGYGMEGFTTSGSYDLVGITFTGYASSDGSTGNECIHVTATTGTVTLNITGGGTTPTIHTEGAIIDVVVNPVTELINVKAGGVNVENARVFVETAAIIASGEMFEATIASLTQSGGVAICDTEAVHGLVTNDKVVIRGAQPDGYNKVATVTVTDTDTFTYSVDSGLSSPATGTPIVSFVVIHGLTNSSGNISASRTWGAAQSLKGWARKKNAASPFYKDADIAYSVDISNGNTTNVVLQPDE